MQPNVCHYDISDWPPEDRYKRDLGKVMLGDKDINLEQIKAGMAWWYWDYKRSQTPEDVCRC